MKEDHDVGGGDVGVTDLIKRGKHHAGDRLVTVELDRPTVADQLKVEIIAASRSVSEMYSLNVNQMLSDSIKWAPEKVGFYGVPVDLIASDRVPTVNVAKLDETERQLLAV